MSWDYNNNNYGGGGYGQSHGSSVPLTGEDARHQLEQMMNGNKNIVSNLQVDTNEKGEGSFLGLRIPKSLVPWLGMGLDIVKVQGIDQSDKVFKGSLSLASTMGFKGYSKTVATAIEFGYRWGIITAEQGIKLIQASSKYAEARKEIFRKFAPITQATGANAKTNGVIKEELKRAEDEWWNDLILISTDAPKLALMIMFGMQKQTEVNAKRHKWIKEHEDHAASQGKSLVDPIAERLKEFDERLKNNLKHQQELAVRRTNFIESQFAAGVEIDGVVDKEKLGKFFDNEHLAEEYQYNRRDYGNTEHNSPKDEKNNTLKWGATFAPVVSQVLRLNVEEATEKQRRASTGDMILHLAQEVAGQCCKDSGYGDGERTAKSAEDITISPLDDKDGASGSRNLKEYIMDVFKRSEQNNGNSGLGKALLAQLEPSADLIAKQIADASRHGLDADAVVAFIGNLVGNNKIIIHNGGERKFATKEQAEAAINELLPALGVQETKKLEEILPDFENPKLAEETIKKNLSGAAALKGEVRSFFGATLPNDVLEKEGLKKAEVIAARKEAHATLDGALAAVAVYLGKKTEGEIKNLNLTEDHMRVVKEIADAIKEDNLSGAKESLESNKDLLLSVTRIAGLNEQMKKKGDGDKFWESRLSEGKALQPKLATAKKQEDKKEESHGDKDAAGDTQWADRVDDGGTRDKVKDMIAKGKSYDKGYGDLEKDRSKGFENDLSSRIGDSDEGRFADDSLKKPSELSRDRQMLRAGQSSEPREGMSLTR